MVKASEELDTVEMPLPLKGRRIGYNLVTSPVQSPYRQDLGVCDRNFNDVSSGATGDRPGLNELLTHVRARDHVVVGSIDRLARSVTDLRRIVSKIVEKGAKIEFLSEKLIFTDQEQISVSGLMLADSEGIAEFERTLIKKHQQERNVKAQQSGGHFGRPKTFSVDAICQHYIDCDHPSMASIVREFGCSLSTVRRALKHFPPYIKDKDKSPAEKRRSYAKKLVME